MSSDYSDGYGRHYSQEIDYSFGSDVPAIDSESALLDIVRVPAAKPDHSRHWAQRDLEKVLETRQMAAEAPSEQ